MSKAMSTCQLADGSIQETVRIPDAAYPLSKVGLRKLFYAKMSQRPACPDRAPLQDIFSALGLILLMDQVPLIHCLGAVAATVPQEICVPLLPIVSTSLRASKQNAFNPMEKA